MEWCEDVSLVFCGYEDKEDYDDDCGYRVLLFYGCRDCDFLFLVVGIKLYLFFGILLF